MLTKGQNVTLLVHGAGLTTKEDATVTCVTAQRFWLNGDEPNEDAAFNLDTGKRSGIFGFSFEVENFPRLGGGSVTMKAKKKVVKKTKKTTTKRTSTATKRRSTTKKTTPTVTTGVPNDGFNAAPPYEDDDSADNYGTSF
jgi:hypothetical protein